MMKLSEHQQHFALDIAHLIIYIFSQGYTCTFGDAYRSMEQAEINAQKGIGIKDSLHCQRLAVDLNIFSPKGEYLSKTEEYKKFGDYWESIHPENRWGGAFTSRRDGNHFERTLK